MSYGLPVVPISSGADGIGLSDGENALIADEPEKFAEKVIKLYTDESLWDKLSENGPANVQQYFSYERAKKGRELVINSIK